MTTNKDAVLSLVDDVKLYNARVLLSAVIDAYFDTAPDNPEAVREACTAIKVNYEKIVVQLNVVFDLLFDLERDLEAAMGCNSPAREPYIKQFLAIYGPYLNGEPEAEPAGAGDHSECPADQPTEDERRLLAAIRRDKGLRRRVKAILWPAGKGGEQG